MDSYSGKIILIAICVILSAFFSATETSFSSLNRVRVKNMANKGNKRASLVIKLTEKYDRLLSTILIGNNIVNIACSSLATLIFVDLLGQEAGAGAATAAVTIVVLIFGEITPKSIAREFSEKFAMFAVSPLYILTKIMTPLTFLFDLWKKLLFLMFKNSDDKAVTEEELLTIVEEAEEGGGIGSEESELIRSAIEFSEVEVCEIMVPRMDITGIPSSMRNCRNILKLFSESGFSRLPVYEENMDHILGVLHQKDFCTYILDGEKLEVDDFSTIIKPAVYVPETGLIDDLLRELQKNKLHMAVVVDEFGGTSGIVTMEDILEELVGDIWDEHDTVVHEIEEISPAEYIVKGSASIEKLFETLGKKEEEFDFVTVSGWITDIFGRIPQQGDTLEHEGWTVEILKQDGHRIESARIRTAVPEENGEKE